MVGLSKTLRYSYGWTLRGTPVFVWMDSWRPPGFRMVGLSEVSRFPYGWTLRHTSVSVWLYSYRPRFSRDWTLTGFPVVVWLESLRPPTFRMIELFEASRFSVGWTLRGSPVLYGCTFGVPSGFMSLDSLRPSVFIFVLLDFYRLPGSRMVGLLEPFRFSYGWTLRCLSVFLRLYS